MGSQGTLAGLQGEEAVFVSAHQLAPEYILFGCESSECPRYILDSHFFFWICPVVDTSNSCFFLHPLLFFQLVGLSLMRLFRSPFTCPSVCFPIDPYNEYSRTSQLLFSILINRTCSELFFKQYFGYTNCLRITCYKESHRPMAHPTKSLSLPSFYSAMLVESRKNRESIGLYILFGQKSQRLLLLKKGRALLSKELSLIVSLFCDTNSCHHCHFRGYCRKPNAKCSIEYRRRRISANSSSNSEYPATTSRTALHLSNGTISTFPGVSCS